MKIHLYVDYVHTYCLGDSDAWYALEVDPKVAERWKKTYEEYQKVQDEISKACKQQGIDP